MTLPRRASIYKWLCCVTAMESLLFKPLTCWVAGELLSQWEEEPVYSFYCRYFEFSHIMEHSNRALSVGFLEVTKVSTL